MFGNEAKSERLGVELLAAFVVGTNDGDVMYFV